MEIDITNFFENAEPYEFSGSIAERGKNAAKETWDNAKAEAARAPMLTTPKQLDALRDHMRGFGAWEREEIDAWDSEHCNALFVQLISGDMREAGIGNQTIDEVNWEAYEKFCESEGGALYRGDNGNVYYHLGD